MLNNTKKLNGATGMCLINNLSIESDNEIVLKHICNAVMQAEKQIRSYSKNKNANGSCTIHFYWVEARSVGKDAIDLPFEITDADTLLSFVKGWFASSETALPSRTPDTDGSFGNGFIARAKNWNDRRDIDPSNFNYQVISITTDYMIYGK